MARGCILTLVLRELELPQGHCSSCGIIERISDGYDSHEDDVLCFYLPLAHIYGRMLKHVSIYAGTQTGYFHRNVLKLVDDLMIFQPTSFPSVPRLLNRQGGTIKSRTVDVPGFRGNLSGRVVKTKLANISIER